MTLSPGNGSTGQRPYRPATAQPVKDLIVRQQLNRSKTFYDSLNG